MPTFSLPPDIPTWGPLEEFEMSLERTRLFVEKTRSFVEAALKDQWLVAGGDLLDSPFVERLSEYPAETPHAKSPI